MSRIYETVVNGKPKNGRQGASGTVDAPIGRKPRDRQRTAVVPSGRPAISHYRVLRAFRNFSHLRVSLESGRTHQIRIHMQFLGHPVVGDPQYGQKPAKPGELSAKLLAAISVFPRQALHARRLSFEHPASLESVSFEAPIPDDMRQLIETLEQYD